MLHACRKQIGYTEITVAALFMENSYKRFWKFAAGFVGVIAAGLLLFFVINFFADRQATLEEGTASQRRIK